MTSAAAQLAVTELTLVLFTTLAPAGILACVVLALAVGFGPLDEKVRARLAHATAIPLAVSMVGLVASATHLGTPANALYVLTGLGRSPLSNEVVCTVAFLALCGLHWLYSFSLDVRRWLQRAWCVAIAASGAAAVVSIGLAYSAPTVLSWATPEAPLAILLLGAGGAPLLVGFTARVARVDVGAAAGRLLYGLGLAATAGALTCLGMQWASIAGLHNAVASVAERVPGYPAMLVAYGIAAVAAYAVVAFALGHARRRNARPSGAALGAACALYLAGAFVVRFGFYMSHMTVGISL